jgi:hypothetical protein
MTAQKGEKVVFVAEDAVLHETREAAGVDNCSELTSRNPVDSGTDEVNCRVRFGTKRRNMSVWVVFISVAKF